MQDKCIEPISVVNNIKTHRSIVTVSVNTVKLRNFQFYLKMTSTVSRFVVKQAKHNIIYMEREHA